MENAALGQVHIQNSAADVSHASILNYLRPRARASQSRHTIGLEKDNVHTPANARSYASEAV